MAEEGGCNVGNRTKYIVSCASVTILPTENMLRKHKITPLALWDTLKTPENKYPRSQGSGIELSFLAPTGAQ